MYSLCQNLVFVSGILVQSTYLRELSLGSWRKNSIHTYICLHYVAITWRCAYFFRQKHLLFFFLYSYIYIYTYVYTINSVNQTIVHKGEVAGVEPQHNNELKRTSGYGNETALTIELTMVVMFSLLIRCAV